MELTSRKLDTRSYPAARLIIVARSANCRIAPQVTEIGAEVTTDSLSCTQVRFIQVCAALAVQCRIQDAVSCLDERNPACFYWAPALERSSSKGGRPGHKFASMTHIGCEHPTSVGHAMRSVHPSYMCRVSVDRAISTLCGRGHLLLHTHQVCTQLSNGMVENSCLYASRRQALLARQLQLPASWSIEHCIGVPVP